MKKNATSSILTVAKIFGSCEKISTFTKIWVSSMLIRLSIENFLSFADPIELSMIPGKSRIKSDHIIQSSSRRDIPVLKSAIIYGANASGKSNIMKALAFAQKLVLKGTTNDTQAIEYKKYKLDPSFKEKKSTIEFELKHKNKNYAYGFVFDHTSIYEEWLYEIDKEREKVIFARNSTKNGKARFDLSGLKPKKDSQTQFLHFTASGTRKNQLFLTECKMRNVKDNVNNIDDIFNVIDWFQNSLKVIFPNTKYQEGLEFELHDNQDMQKIFHEFLNYFNTGIKGIIFEKIAFDDIRLPQEVKGEIKSEFLASEYESKKAFVADYSQNLTYLLKRDEYGEIDAFKMMTTHEVKNSDKLESFEIPDESDGTQRIIDFIPAIMDLFKGGNVFFIDEVDRSLHPNLIYDLVDLFLSKSKGVSSQLIVTTHESGLLSQKLVRKDEVWFILKDKYGASKLYSLEEFKVRFDKEIRKDYLLGRFKAVPVFGSRNHLTVLR